MALRPRWRQEPFELIAEADFTGRTTGVDYDLLFPFALDRTDTITILISNLKVYDPTPNNIQSTSFQFQYNGTLYTTARTVLANTWSTLGEVTSYLELVYRPQGYDLTDLYYALHKRVAYGTTTEGELIWNENLTTGTPSAVTLTGIRLNHSNSYITNQAIIKVFRNRR